MKKDVKELLVDKVIGYIKSEEPNLTAKEIRVVVSSTWRKLSKEIKG